LDKGLIGPARSSHQSNAAAKAAAARAKKAKKLKAHGRAGQKVHYRGDAGVAARHVNAGHVSHPARSAPHRATPKQSPQAKPKSHLPPGPFDVKPPPGQGNGKGK
jgi:hypothetical protein